ncbi:hypothetical protein [Actinacidiphila guanduensis]|uniref:Uncharacterized protein n=1 Tax=Actinacidiphila guanduensis TaxID=310781 RepID=A0A1H0FRW9_9ACTN|nr:hypothetical protein [Actinacidiphila guanduensis]SDN97387.1 hypothetical protein SAMN05216259_106405 [Actinacidiphila guanduensis]
MSEEQQGGGSGSPRGEGDRYGEATPADASGNRNGPGGDGPGKGSGEGAGSGGGPGPGSDDGNGSGDGGSNGRGSGNGGSNGDGNGPGQASVPEGLVAAVVNLVHTGPVLLGAYTIAELTAVDAIVDFLEARPSDDELAEAVRSLAARELLLAGDGDEVQVRGDLGIAVAFQQRARKVLDARTTGTQAGEPWRILVLPQPERICLMVRIDALGVHQMGLYKLDEAVRILVDWLPRGQSAEPEPDSDAVLDGAERAALLTVTEYTAEGSAEIAGASTDMVLARRDGRLHLYTREPEQGDRLVPGAVEGKEEVRERLARLLA